MRTKYTLCITQSDEEKCNGKQTFPWEKKALLVQSISACQNSYITAYTVHCRLYTLCVPHRVKYIISDIFATSGKIILNNWSVVIPLGGVSDAIH